MRRDKMLVCYNNTRNSALVLESTLPCTKDMSMLQETHRLAALVFVKRNITIGNYYQTKHTPLLLMPPIHTLIPA